MYRTLEYLNGIADDDVRRLRAVHQCTVLEVSGMDRWIPLMRRLGIVTMESLRRQDAAELHAKLLEAIGLAGAPGVTDVQYWISQATALDIVEEPEPVAPRSVIS
ncbi:MAG: hypothetical protein E6H90_13825 [Chloroflexi bacterium]|nr:MAG: hypothetical protein E6H90_13825 [Chloroflexota bacterium]